MREIKTISANQSRVNLISAFPYYEYCEYSFRWYPDYSDTILYYGNGCMAIIPRPSEESKIKSHQTLQNSRDV